MLPLSRMLFVLLLAAVAGGLLWLGYATRPKALPEHRAGRDLLPRVTMPAEAAPPASPSSPFITTDPRLRAVADPGLPLPARYEAVDRLLARPLPHAVLGEVLAFLRSAVPAGDAAAERERALRNALLNRLREHPEHAAMLVPALAELAADASQDPGLRDYALQHLATWAPALPPDGCAQAVAALKAALRETAGTYAGTALLGLNDLARREALPGAFDVASQARRIALDENTSEVSRLTALALVAELGVADAALSDLARRWSEPSSPVPEGARRAARVFLKRQNSLN